MVGIPGIKGEAAEVSQMAVFNTNFLALSPDTRTDKEAEAAIRLIGHELFHMWAGELWGGSQG
jgi:aminopeptidase N